MDEDTIRKLVDGKPEILIEEMAKKGIDFSGLEKDIARKLVKERFNLDEDKFEAADFIFWISYFMEKSAEELIMEPEIMLGGRKEALEIIIGKLHFGDKIKIIEELYTGKNDPLIKLMRKIQDFRNDVAHGRFENLKYSGYSLSDNRAKLILVGQLRDAFRKK